MIKKKSSKFWFQFQDGEEGGDVVAVPQAKEHHGGDSGPILPVPRGIRPTLAKYRLEVSGHDRYGHR